MKKYVIMAMISSFIGIMANPEMLMASDRVEVAGLNNAGIVETVLPEPVSEEAQAAVVTAPANNIQINGQTMPTHMVGAPAQSVGPDVYIYRGERGQFIYAHNSANRFATLYSLNVGSTFTITTNGVTKTYRVTDAPVHYYVNTLERTKSNLGGLVMIETAIQDYAYNNETGRYHDVALMTCYDTNDAQRWFIFADEV